MMNRHCARVCRLMTGWLLTFASAGLLPHVAQGATPWHKLYDPSLLSTTAATAQAQLSDNLRQHILPSLSAEFRPAASRIRIVVEVTSRDDQLLAFAASPSAGVIFVSATSIRMFGDLLYAWAWLTDRGHSPESVLAYLSVLKYQYAGSKIIDSTLNPLTVLGVPANVRDDPRLSEQVNRQFNSAMFFILCHEVAHIVKQHRVQAHGLQASASQAQEVEADQLALSVMQNIGQTPEGIVYLLLFNSVLERFAIDVGGAGAAAFRTHPLSVDRAIAMAIHMRDHAHALARVQRNETQSAQTYLAIAATVETAVRGVLDNEATQRRWHALGHSLTLADLGPRPGAILAAPVFKPPAEVLGPSRSNEPAGSNSIQGRWVDDESILSRAYYDFRPDMTYSYAVSFQGTAPKIDIEVREQGTYTARAGELTLHPTSKSYKKNGIEEPDSPQVQNFQWSVGPDASGGRTLRLTSGRATFTYRSP